MKWIQRMIQISSQPILQYRYYYALRYRGPWNCQIRYRYRGNDAYIYAYNEHEHKHSYQILHRGHRFKWLIYHPSTNPKIVQKNRSVKSRIRRKRINWRYDLQGMAFDACEWTFSLRGAQILLEPIHVSASPPSCPHPDLTLGISNTNLLRWNTNNLYPAAHDCEKIQKSIQKYKKIYKKY